MNPMGEKVCLVAVGLKSDSSYLLEESLEELRELARSAGGAVVDEVKALVERPHPATYVGSGKLDEIRRRLEEKRFDLVIFNLDLSPVQTRNIESYLGLRVVDRTGLILDIFARRARSHEGRLQVELAQLMYLMPRLTGKGVLLSRLGGGIGTRGPGEKKLEYDRRRIRERVGRLKKDIDKIRTHRLLIRKGRKRKDLVTVALVGYTNSGKSTLLNALTGSSAAVEDKLFATLDPMTRLYDKGQGALLFTDTVGFLMNLPPDLVDAFQATLEEIGEADVLVHVMDAAHPQAEEHAKVVNEILRKLHCDSKPVVVAFNKMDLIASQEERARLTHGRPDAVAVSAKEKKGLAELVARIQEVLARTNGRPPLDGESQQL